MDYAKINEAGSELSGGHDQILRAIVKIPAKTVMKSSY